MINICSNASAAILTISGKLAIDGTPVRGVTIYVNNGVRRRGYTDKFGAYSIIVPQSGTYTLTPFIRNKYIPTSPNKTITVGTTSVTNVDFDLLQIESSTGVITGRVTTSAGLPLEGVKIRTSKSSHVTTDANGLYRFINLGIGRYFTFPSADGFTFSGNQRDAKLRSGMTLQHSFIGYPKATTDSYSTFFAGVWDMNASVSNNTCALTETSISGKTLITQRKNFIFVSVPRLGTYRGAAGKNAFTLPVSGFKSLCRITGTLNGTFQNSSNGSLSGTLSVTCITAQSTCSFDVSADLSRAI